MPATRTESGSTPPAASEASLAPLGILCGGGTFPIAVARAASHSCRKVVLVAIRGFADPAVLEGAGFPVEWVHLGTIGAMLAALRRHGCREMVIVGYVFRPRISSLRLDWKAIGMLRWFLRARRGGDGHLLSHIASFFEKEGFILRGAHEVAPEILVAEGTLGRVAMTEAEREDARIGFRLLRAIDDFDVGQAAVVAERHVQAIEAAEGTDAMIARCGEMRASGRVRLPRRSGVLVKIPKPGQDRRIDLPSIGVRTVERAAEAGLAGIAVEAGGVIAAEAEAMVRVADEKGLFIVGLAE